MDFKPGDLVMCLKNHDPGNQYTKGKIYIVLGVSKTTLDTTDDSFGSNGWSKEFFVKIKPTKLERLIYTIA